MRDAAFGERVTFSKKVFIPLTHLCRDTCGYCTFVHPPQTRRGGVPHARAGAGDRARGPGRRLRRGAVHPGRQARAQVEAGRRGAGGDGPRDDARLSRRDGRAGLQGDRPAAAFQSRPDGRGRSREAAQVVGVDGHHAGEHGRAARRARRPAFRRARTRCRRCGSPPIAAAGKAKVPFTSGILIGIGETRAERIEALLALRELHRRARSSAGSDHPELQGQARHAHGRCARSRSFDELLWTVAVARLIFGDTLSVQAPPNLQEPGYGRLIEAGIDDWGGVSPVTPDHVNPERPWPQLDGAGGRERAPRQGADRAARGLSALRRRQGLDRSGAAPARAGDELGERPAPRQRLEARPRHADAGRRHGDAGAAGGAAERQPGADRRSRGARRRISAKATSCGCSRRADPTSRR